ncbi:MAG: tetratricopeptide repeat protein [Chloroflexi bacterium]|nr:tetratricopeptide repeat protein [Chloroflexota bacterium]
MPTVGSLCALARRSLNAHEAGQAISLAGYVLRLYPKAIDAHCVLGEAYAVMGQASKSGDHFRLVLSADPENVSALTGLGAAYRIEGRLPEALVQLERALDLQPDDARLRREVLGLNRQHDGASADRLKPTRAALGRIYLRSGLYRRAAKELGAVVVEDPNRLDAAVGQAEALWRAETYGEAAQVCNSLLCLAPDCLKAKLLLADMGLAGHLQTDYRSLRDEAHRMDPDDRMASDLFAETESARRWQASPADLPWPIAFV